MSQDTTPATQTETQQPFTISAKWRAVISVLVCLHVAAVFSAPYALPPTPAVATRVWEFFQPYLQACYLNHGYAFFSPDPGPSHLIRYEIELGDGEQIEGIFPNLEEHQPRLLYHRHFMMSEFLTVGPRASEGRRAYLRSYAEHLLHKYDAEKVTLYFITHELPGPLQVNDGMRLDDPSLYQEQREITLLADGTADYPPEAFPSNPEPEAVPLRPTPVPDPIGAPGLGQLMTPAVQGASL